MFKFIDLNLYKWRAIYYDNLKKNYVRSWPESLIFFLDRCPGDRQGKITLQSTVNHTNRFDVQCRSNLFVWFTPLPEEITIAHTPLWKS